jgi:outer membrane protein TolC|tara:strand:- start:4288 stop:5610 length:1323 start_codon:yes stop_codon:yes gene_type:complete
MNKFKTLSFAVIYLTFYYQIIGQEILTKDLAVKIALENNFEIKVAINTTRIAENNAALTNSDYLPSLSGSAGSTFASSNSKNTFQDNTIVSVSGVETVSYNAGLTLNYSLFNGFGRKYNYQKLQENYNLTALQARKVMENTLFNIFFAYYEIARLTQDQLNQNKSLAISKERLTKAIFSFEYGQNTKLDVLNAEVDFNNDSINYLNISQSLKTEKNNLNLLLGRSINTSFEVDTTLTFYNELAFEVLSDKAHSNNVDVLEQTSNLRNAETTIKISASNIIPSVGLNTRYNWQNNDFGPVGFLAAQQSNGLNIGAALSWNIWDGGKSNTLRQNTKIALENETLSMDQTLLNLDRNLNNAWTSYQTALFIMKAQNKNLETNQRNFERTKEQYTLGQITSIFFRQAQLNLLNAQVNYNNARYSAKKSELGLLQLSGDLLQTTF